MIDEIANFNYTSKRIPEDIRFGVHSLYFSQRKTDKPPIKPFTLSQRAADVVFIYRRGLSEAAKQQNKKKAFKKGVEFVRVNRVVCSWRELPYYLAPVTSVSL